MKKRTLAMLCQIKSVPQIPKFNFLMFPFTLLLQKNKHNFLYKIFQVEEEAFLTIIFFFQFILRGKKLSLSSS